MCCDHLPVVLLFTVAGAVLQQTGQVAWSCLQHIVEDSGMPFPSHQNSRVLKVFQNRHVSRFGPSHMCVLLLSSSILYVYCFEFMLLANRLQNISRMSFPLLPSPLPNHTEQDRASSNPSRCFVFAVHSECGQSYFFPFYLDFVAVKTNIFFPSTVCLISRQTTAWLFSMVSKVKGNSWCLYFCKKALEVKESSIAIG